MKLSPFRCRDGDPKCLGGFMQGALLQVTKFDNIPKFWSQLCDCVSQSCLLFSSCANLLGIWHRVAQFGRVCGVFHPNSPRCAILADFHQRSINLTSTVFRAGCFVFYDLGFFSSLPALTCHVLRGCITWAGMPSVA